MSEKIEIALLGRKLGHSLSPEIHKYLGSYDYRLYPLEPEQLDGFFERRDFRGLNVTIPYKIDAVKYCNELSPSAVRIGCVNTIVRRSDGSLYGDNTDYFGFSYMAKSAGISFAGKKVLILGTGGASLTADIVARDEGAREVVKISRSGENNYGNITLHDDAEVIINCTPVGMYPNNGERLIDLDAFPKCVGVLDMIYNPQRSCLLLDAADRGIENANGLAMLVAQAAKSAEYFRRDEESEVSIDDIIARIAREQRNIVLIGMPGCGKSTAAELLSKRLGRKALDTDEMVVRLAGKSIPDIFAQDGEEHFRDLEAECVAQAAKEAGKIIATGGGAILRAENRDALRGNSVVVFLKRDISQLGRDGRPLSSDEDALRQMYDRRIGFYRSAADVEIEVADTKQQTLEAIIKALENI